MNKQQNFLFSSALADRHQMAYQRRIFKKELETETARSAQNSVLKYEMFTLLQLKTVTKKKCSKQISICKLLKRASLLSSPTLKVQSFEPF